jgi:hypothetical protein
MTQKQIALMRALSRNHHHMSLTDAIDEDVQALLECGWARIWHTAGGFPAIGLTDEGVNALRNA